MASSRIVPDDLWERIEPLLPKKERRFRYPGRLPVPDRQVLCGILYVLHTGIQWEHLPKELGPGSGMTCWRRLRDWNEAGVRQRLREVLLAELNAAARLDWSRWAVGSSHVRAIAGLGHVRSVMACLLDRSCRCPGVLSGELAAIRCDLEDFAAEMFEPFAQADQRRWGGVYLRGLLLDGARKSVEPMAARLSEDGRRW